MGVPCVSKPADRIQFTLQPASAHIEKSFFISSWWWTLQKVFPLKAISLPELQVQKHRCEITLGVAKQSLKQKATLRSFISCGPLSAVLQRHEIRLRLFWALWPFSWKGGICPAWILRWDQSIICHCVPQRGNAVGLSDSAFLCSCDEWPA